MKYYSTNRTVPMASLHEAVVKGLAGDKGLFMPERIKPLPKVYILARGQTFPVSQKS